jgi:putative chitinase
MTFTLPTPEQLQKLFPRGQRLGELHIALPCIVELASFTEPEHLAMFLAQTAHESDQYKYSRELWGPTNQQARYERVGDAAWPPSEIDKRNKLAYQLGNMKPGDGFRFRGWGPLQITGRTNTEAALAALGLEGADLSRLDDFRIGLLGAVWYWNTRKLKGLPLRACTIRINGGLNGVVQRTIYYNKLLKALDVANPEVHTCRDCGDL